MTDANTKLEEARSRLVELRAQLLLVRLGFMYPFDPAMIREIERFVAEVSACAVQQSDSDRVHAELLRYELSLKEKVSP
jgi:hypothetical protein